MRVLFSGWGWEESLKGSGSKAIVMAQWEHVKDSYRRDTEGTRRDRHGDTGDTWEGDGLGKNPRDIV